MEKQAESGDEMGSSMANNDLTSSFLHLIVKVTSMYLQDDSSVTVSL